MREDPKTPHAPASPTGGLDRSRRPDPGSPGAARIAWVVLIVSFLLVAGIQAVGALLADQTSPTTAPIDSPAIDSPDNQQDRPANQPAQPEPLFEMVTKLTIATAASVQEIQSVEELRETGELVGGFARSEADRVRVAIVVAEIGRGVDPQAELALARLGSIETGDPAIKQDIDTLRARWLGQPAEPSDETRLVERYGFYGEVALVHARRPGADAPVIDRLSRLLFTFLAATGVGGAMLAIGGVLLLIAVVRLLTRKFEMRFVPPAPGGSVYLEAAAVFVAGFLVLKGVLVGVAALPIDPVRQTLIALGLQWVLLAAALWPLLRGVRFHEWSMATGWHRGSGLFKEMAFGLVGWLASLPVFVGAAMFTSLLVAAWELIKGGDGEARPLPDAGALDLIASGNIALIVAMTALATIWAPLAEESIFRGCLYRHVRGRLGVALSAGLVAAIFGLMHGYGLLFVPPVIALGFCFSIMREWRGSLVAPVTAHLLHNATLTTFMIVMANIMRT